MLLFRDKEPAFCPAPSPLMRKEPASKNIGDEQLSLLRLLAGIVPHEIKILRSLFNANDNHCQLFVRVFFIHDW